MSDFIKPGYAIIVSVQGVSPGPANGITYTVQYVKHDGTTLPDVPNQVPFRRWYATWILAHPVGLSWPVVFAGSRLISTMPEELPESVTECGQ